MSVTNSNNPTLQEKYSPLIIALIFASILILAIIAHAVSIQPDPSRYGSVSALGFLISVFSLIYSLLGTLYLTEIAHDGKIKRMIVAVGVISFLIVVVISLHSSASLPYYGECRNLAYISDISFQDCMGVVTLDRSYTGQEIIDLVKSGEIAENAERQEDLNSQLVP